MVHHGKIYHAIVYHGKVCHTIAAYQAVSHWIIIENTLGEKTHNDHGHYYYINTCLQSATAHSNTSHAVLSLQMRTALI